MLYEHGRVDKSVDQVVDQRVDPSVGMKPCTLFLNFKTLV